MSASFCSEPVDTLESTDSLESVAFESVAFILFFGRACGALEVRVLAVVFVSAVVFQGVRVLFFRVSGCFLVPTRYISYTHSLKSQTHP